MSKNNLNILILLALINNSFLYSYSDFKKYIRFENQNVVVDLESGLIWEDQPNIAIKNRNEAVKYCENLDLDGYHGWRLPFIEELETLHDSTKNNPAIDPTFKNISSDWYWSITKFHSNSLQGWLKRFYGSQNIGLDLTFQHSVKCVRSLDRDELDQINNFNLDSESEIDQ